MLKSRSIYLGIVLSIFMAIVYFITDFGPDVQPSTNAFAYFTIISSLILLLNRFIKIGWIDYSLLILIALAQVLPALWWLQSHGMYINDGHPADAGVYGQWVYAVPHIILFIVVISRLIFIVKDNR